ncbi:MAG TPA: hypothetical protein VMX55_14780 [candidate division Zixibacteria bacterium]|nr:hypothetical protein [candidate division Zixibacteria bacterium]
MVLTELQLEDLAAFMYEKFATTYLIDITEEKFKLWLEEWLNKPIKQLPTKEEPKLEFIAASFVFGDQVMNTKVKDFLHKEE